MELNVLLQGWSKLRKRDGTRYTNDYRRVISASLANTSSASPLFEVNLNINFLDSKSFLIIFIITK